MASYLRAKGFGAGDSFRREKRVRIPGFCESRAPSPVFSIFQFPFSTSPIQQSGGKKANEFFRPTAIYPQDNKGPNAEYFVLPKMAHPTENTGVVSCISFKACRSKRLTHGCLESLQSEKRIWPSANTSLLRFSLGFEPESRLSSRVANPDFRVPAIGISHVQAPAVGTFLARVPVSTNRRRSVPSASPQPRVPIFFSQRSPNPGPRL